MKLLIISHTPHYYNKDGILVSWGSTAREINHLLDIFESIIHVAPLCEGLPPNNLLPYTSDRISFRPIHATGGHSFKDKMGVLLYAPNTLRIVAIALNESDIFQFRAPTGIGVYLIPYLLCLSKKGWFKYAGNWVQKCPPVGYSIQRFYLSRTKRIVTINGHWPNQKHNQLSFENPCLSEEDCLNGMNSMKNKRYDGVLNFVFVGRLEDAKGIQRILDAFISLGPNNRIGKIHLVGDGIERKRYELFANSHGLNKVVFHGYLPNYEVNNIYAQSHIIILPSVSEGFPKVIAEGCNYGCIPLVSDISCIGQYVKQGVNGFLIDISDAKSVEKAIRNCLSNRNLPLMAENAHQCATLFTYSRYNERITSYLISE